LAGHDHRFAGLDLLQSRPVLLVEYLHGCSFRPVLVGRPAGAAAQEVAVSDDSCCEKDDRPTDGLCKFSPDGDSWTLNDPRNRLLFLT
jgi:hypothetical protein